MTDARAALEPFARLPIGAEIEEDVDLVLYKNAGRAITVGDVLRARIALSSLPAAPANITEAQVKHMVDRFLAWRLPEDFTPDAGISFKRTFNEHTAHPMKHEPVGTNLFTYAQAEAMVRHMIEGLSPSLPAAPVGVPEGYVLVPHEPTEFMVEVGKTIRSTDTKTVYDAMLSAAPSAPAPSGGVTQAMVDAADEELRRQNYAPGRFDMRRILKAAMAATPGVETLWNIDAAARFLAETVMQYSWDGLYNGTCAPDYPAWKVGGHANARKDDYRSAAREIVAKALMTAPYATPPAQEAPGTEWDQFKEAAADDRFSNEAIGIRIRNLLFHATPPASAEKTTRARAVTLPANRFGMDAGVQIEGQYRKGIGQEPSDSITTDDGRVFYLGYDATAWEPVTEKTATGGGE